MKVTPLGGKDRKGKNAMHENCKRAHYAQRTGVEGNCPGMMGRGRQGEGSRERLMALLGLELLRDLAEDRQYAADLLPLGTLLLARALWGRGKLVV